MNVIIKPILFFVIIAFAVNTSLADKRPSTVDSGLAVVIERKSDNISPLEIDNLITTALENYCYHFLQKKGVNFQVFTINSISNSDSLVSVFSRKYFTKIILIKNRDLYFKTSKIVTDNHGRRYFKTINNNLDLIIYFQKFDYKNGNWSKGIRSNLREKGNWEWYSHDIQYRWGNKNIVGRAEPYEFIIQRVVARLFDEVVLSERKPVKMKAKIPLRIYLGKGLEGVSEIYESSDYKQIINYASDQFYNQFGLGFNLTGLERIDSLVDEVSFYNYQLNSNPLFLSDTIELFIFNRFSFWEYFNLSKIKEIGYSRLGNKVIRIKLFPNSVDSRFDWNVYYNSLTLLHEIGHSFGAIHTSDINSIMNYSYSWVGPNSYDPVNTEIIKASLQGKINPRDASKYLAFISKVLQKTDYGLVDFPSFFYEFLQLKNNKKFTAKLRNAIGYRPYLLAIDGYEMFLKKEYEKAAILFREAIRYEPKQASLFYYLSLVTKGEESIQARHEALIRGYVNAID